MQMVENALDGKSSLSLFSSEAGALQLLICMLNSSRVIRDTNSGELLVCVFVKRVCKYCI